MISSAGGFQTIVIRVTNGPPLAFNYNPEYLGRISWAGNENVSPVEAVFILSNVSQSDSKEYGCTAAQGAAAGSRIIDLIVTGKETVSFVFVLFCYAKLFCNHSRTSFEKNCFSAWASTLNMGLINKVDMVCLSPVGYGV